GEHVGAHVAQVLVGVHGRAAAVHAGHVAGRDEVLHPPAERVVEAKGTAVRHGPPGYRRRRSLKSWSRRIRRSASARCRSSSFCFESWTRLSTYSVEVPTWTGGWRRGPTRGRGGGGGRTA